MKLQIEKVNDSTENFNDITYREVNYITYRECQ